MKEKKEVIDLFQDFCAHYEEVLGITPLTAQVYTYILFHSNREGITFDELVENLCASKSSISTSLNTLVNNQQIEYFNKIDERKRYFRLNAQFLDHRLEIIKNRLENETRLHVRLEELINKEMIEISFFQKKMKLFREHIEFTIRELKETINKLKNAK